MVKRYGLAAASTLVAVMMAVMGLGAPAWAQGVPISWTSLQYLNGQDTNGYHPSFGDLGAACYYNQSLDAYWAQLPGPEVEGPHVDTWYPPDTSLITFDGSGPSTAQMFQNISAGYTASGGGKEPIFYLPSVYFNGQWNYAKTTSGVYQWMLT